MMDELLKRVERLENLIVDAIREECQSEEIVTFVKEQLEKRMGRSLYLIPPKDPEDKGVWVTQLSDEDPERVMSLVPIPGLRERYKLWKEDDESGDDPVDFKREEWSKEDSDEESDDW